MIRFQKIIITILIGITYSHFSFGLTNLNQVKVKETGEIEITFSGKVDQSQTQIDYFNDIIQMSLNGVSVFPAKMSSPNEGFITKVFAYQYSPKLVRFRITVKGKAEDYKERLQVKNLGKVLKISFDNSVHETKKSDAQKVIEVVQENEDEVDEKILMDRVLKANNEPSIVSQPVLSAPEKVEPKVESKIEPKSESKVEPLDKPRIATGKALPSLFSIFWKLGAVVLFFGFIMILIKKVKSPNSLSAMTSTNEKGLFGQIKKLASQGFKGDPKLIQIVSTQYLGPKKSIVVARVSDRLLVLGVSSDSIQLITQIPEYKDGQKSNEFSDLLIQEEEESEKNDDSSELNGPIAPVVGVRSRIKNRLEGLKPL